MPKIIAYAGWQGEDAHAALPCLARFLRDLAREAEGEFLFWNPSEVSAKGLLMLHDEQVRRVQEAGSQALRALRERMVAITESIALATPNCVYFYELYLRDMEGKPQAGIGLYDARSAEALEDDTDMLLQREAGRSLIWMSGKSTLVRHMALWLARTPTDVRAPEGACGRCHWTGLKSRAWQTQLEERPSTKRQREWARSLASNLAKLPSRTSSRKRCFGLAMSPQVLTVP